MGSENSNRFGLSRTIPAEVKLQIRKREGFGCVICGVGIIEYEHVDPEFKDAEVHDPLKMTILCPTCHAKKTRGFLSVDTIKRAMLSPKCLEVGFSKEVLDIGTESPRLIFAGAQFQNCVYPIMVQGKPLFMIQPPEIEEGPWRFSARFYDSLGNCSLTILDNEWFSSSDNWDVELSGRRLIIKENSGVVHLELKNSSSDIVEIIKIRSVIGDTLIEGNQNEFKIIDLMTGVERSRFQAVSASECLIGMMF